MTLLIILNEVTQIDEVVLCSCDLQSLRPLGFARHQTILQPDWLRDSDRAVDGLQYRHRLQQPRSPGPVRRTGRMVGNMRRMRTVARDLFNPPATRVLPGLNTTGTTDVGVTSRRGADRTGDGRPYSCTVLSLLALARHLGIRLSARPAGGPCHDRRRRGTSPGSRPDPSRRGVQPIRRRQATAGTVGAD